MTDTRPHSADECRTMLFETMVMSFKYWRDLPRDELSGEGSEIHKRMEGLLFSLMVMFDGGTSDIPGLNIIPEPHPEDKEYHQAEGENWWPVDTIINDIQMHEVFPWGSLK